MANPMVQKKLEVIDSREVGEIIQCVAAPSDKWLPLRGQLVSRSKYPKLYDLYKIGRFTTTLRTLNAVPVAYSITADSTNFLVPGAAGTSPLQASPTGASWSTSATWTAATSPASLIKSGTRFVMAGSGGDLTAPYVSAIDQTAANQVAKANWTATTGGFTTTLSCGLAYSPSLGVTVGVPNGAGTAIYTLADGATAWTAQTATSANKFAVCWTGRKFIAAVSGLTNLIQTSTEGMTWVDAYLPISYNTTDAGGMVSDGAGTVVIYTTSQEVGYGLMSEVGCVVSKDHGETWMFVSYLMSEAGGDATKISFAGGKFFATHNGTHSIVSADALAWINCGIQEANMLRNATNTFTVAAYKSGVWLGVSAANTSAYTFTEDTSLFTLPTDTTQKYTDVGYVHFRIGSLFIKAKP